MTNPSAPLVEVMAELPAPDIWVREDFGLGDTTIHTGFTADQMHDYARKHAAPILAKLEASRAREVALREALHIIAAQSIADDWTAAEALGFVKAHARAALALPEGGQK